MTAKKYEEHEGHPSVDESGRHPGDQVLRKYGWQIHSRPKGREAKWSRRREDGSSEAVAERKAVARLRREFRLTPRDIEMLERAGYRPPKVG